MMNGFSDFIEMTDAINEPAGTRVTWYDDGGAYYFDIAGDVYSLAFDLGRTSWGYGLNFEKVLVTFTGPRDFRLTHKFQAPRVYREVIKGFKAMIAKFNPEVIQFSAFDERTIPIYRSLYERFLKPYFTQVGSEDYLRNDLYQKHNTGDQAKAFQHGAAQAQQHADYLRQRRDYARQYWRDNIKGGL